MIMNFTKELEFILAVLNPFSTNDLVAEKSLNYANLNETKLVKTLKCNKLFESFEKRFMQQDSDFRNQFLSSFPKLNETLF